MIDQSNRLFVCIYKHVFSVLFFFPIPTFPTFFPILSFMMRDGDKIIENLRRILFEENEEPTPTPTPTSTSTSTLIVKPKKSYITANDILTIFGINKETYNNLLVRQEIKNIV